MNTPGLPHESGRRVGRRGMSVEFCGLTLAHPVINGSGTFDALAARKAVGAALDAEFPFAAYVSKTITLESRAGNPPPRLWESPAGLVNSIGLPNKGLAGSLTEDLPQLAPRPVPVITNVMGSTAAEIAELLEACDARTEIAAVELNVSCPNVKTGLDIGADPRQLGEVVRTVRRGTGKPLIVKLTPNAADVAACALAAEAGGADAVSLINTLRATAPTPVSRDDLSVSQPYQPWLGGGTGGLSGPAIRAVALAQLAAVTARVSIPAVGMGGVSSAAHALDMVDGGATLVAVGTESFRDPAVGARIARGLLAARPR